MLLICSNCSTSYALDPATVGPAGRTVRCARCHDTWFVNPPEPPDPVEAFVDGVMAEAEAEAAQQRREMVTVEGLSTGAPLYARDLDATVQTDAPHIEA